MARPKKEAETKDTNATFSMTQSLAKKMNFPRKHTDFFNRIGIIGWGSISSFLATSLFNGSVPILLGSHGLGKTYACKRLATKLLGFDSKTFLTVDGSKADFEELLGMPNLNILRTENRVEYVRSELSIWDKQFLLVDELTRAQLKIQNAMLETFRGKTVHHKKTDLKYTFAAANDITYPGCEPLDDALADRFSFILTPPGTLDLSDEELEEVLEQGESVDDFMLSQNVEGYVSKDTQIPDLSKEFAEYLKQVGVYWKKINGKLKIEKYVKAFAKTYEGSLSTKEGSTTGEIFDISPRRASMMAREIKARVALEYMEYETYVAENTAKLDEAAKEAWLKENAFTKDEKTEFLRKIIFDTVLAMVNTKLTGKKVSNEGLQAAHQMALKVIDSDDLNDLYKIKSEANPIKKMILALGLNSGDELEIYNAYGQLEKIISEDVEFKDEKARAALLFFQVPHTAFSTLKTKLPNELKEKMDKMISEEYDFCTVDNQDDLPEVVRNDIGFIFDTNKFATDYFGDREILSAFTADALNLSPIERTTKLVALSLLVKNDEVFADKAEHLSDIDQYQEEKTTIEADSSLNQKEKDKKIKELDKKIQEAADKLVDDDKLIAEKYDSYVKLATEVMMEMTETAKKEGITL